MAKALHTSSFLLDKKAETKTLPVSLKRFDIMYVNCNGNASHSLLVLLLFARFVTVYLEMSFKQVFHLLSHNLNLNRDKKKSRLKKLLTRGYPSCFFLTILAWASYYHLFFVTQQNSFSSTRLVINQFQDFGIVNLDL